MRGDWFWPAVIWALLVGVGCWLSPPFGKQECQDHIPRAGEMVRAASTVKDSLTVRRETVSRVGYPVEPIREEWGEWD